MIQNSSNVNKPVYPIDPEKIEKMWKEERIKTKDIQMKDEESDEDKKKKHRKVFDKIGQNNFYNSYGTESSSSSDESG